MSNNIPTTAHFVLEKDVFDPEDETVDSEEFTRDLQAALLEAQASPRDEALIRVTEFIAGQPVTSWRYGDGPQVIRLRT